MRFRIAFLLALFFWSGLLAWQIDTCLPPPPPPLCIDPEPFRVVEQMPLFGDCRKKSCSDREMLEYIFKRISRLPLPKDVNPTKSLILVQFTVDRKGRVCDATIARGIHPELDRQVLRIFRGMPAWEPGHQRGRPVPVRLELPVRIRLE